MKRFHNLGRQIWSRRWIYLMFLPALVLYILFVYVPGYGAILAFKDLNYNLGIMKSPWAANNGMAHFIALFRDAEFWRACVNTVIISLGRIIIEFPMPIILSLMLNELFNRKYKKIIQTILTFPHFISWVILSGIFLSLLSGSGVINQMITALGGQEVNFLTNSSSFRWLLYATNIWKEAGWSSIIYLAAIAAINPELYSAAYVDGAHRGQVIRYITLPAIISVIGVMFILAISNMMNAGFDQVFNMYNGAVMTTSDIIDTYVYRKTFITGINFSMSTAAGLFKSTINLLLLLIANAIVKKSTGKGIY